MPTSFSLRAIIVAALLLCCLPSIRADERPSLKVMAWNIWHGGKEDGEESGPQRVIDVIRDSGADIVAMQETYGSGKKIAEELGFYFHERGTNVSIHSRFPVVEDISVFGAFKCVGGLLETTAGQRIAFYSIWLPYEKDIWLPGVRSELTLEQWKAACRPSAKDLKVIHTAIQKRLADEKYADVSIVIAGDFNSMSHTDYTDLTVDQFGRSVDWETSHVLTDAGFRDSYREANPVVDRNHDSTWSPRFYDQEQDRIDFIYYRSKTLQTQNSTVITNHAQKFPSDHGALLTTFGVRKSAPSPLPLRAMSYNIRHGQGSDRKLDLKRTAEVIKAQQADFVALQEVDRSANRSGNVNQAAELGRLLNMHAAFGPFMEFQSGHYGMAVLSRFPIRSVTPLHLPTGNEPRIALVVKVVLPDDRELIIADVHFDWVKDDGFRYQQAKVLHEYLSTLKTPYVLLGDFNDQRGSRTLNLLSANCVEPAKPANANLTFSATKPVMEIDFIFAGPQNAWQPRAAIVVPEAVASDHRPVVAELLLP